MVPKGAKAYNKGIRKGYYPTSIKIIGKKKSIYISWDEYRELGATASDDMMKVK